MFLSVRSLGSKPSEVSYDFAWLGFTISSGGREVLKLA